MHSINFLAPFMGLFLFIGAQASFIETTDPIWPYQYLANATDMLQNGVSAPWFGHSTPKSTSTQAVPPLLITGYYDETLAVDDVDTILGYLKRFSELIGESDDWEYVNVVLHEYSHLLGKAVLPRPEILLDLSIWVQLLSDIETILQLDKRIEVRYDCQNHRRRSRVLYTLG